MRDTAAARLAPRAAALVQLVARADPFDGCRTHRRRLPGDPERFAQYETHPQRSAVWTRVDRDNERLR